MKPRTLRLSRIVFILVFLALIAGFALALWAKFHTDRPEEVSTSVAAPKPSAPREIQGATVDAAGNLILTYSDGSVTNAGRVVGQSGKAGEGLYPTIEQLDDAVTRYCADGRCDPKRPAMSQVLAAVATYCSDGACRGKTGVAGPAPTAAQLSAAVSAYCADGRCKGDQGPTGATGSTGAQGPAGRTTVMNCVERTTNNTRTRYVAWKYTDEADSAYRNLYKLPVWAECSNPVVLS